MSCFFVIMRVVILMKMNEKCLPCLVSQVIKTANICHIDDKEKLYKKVFLYLSQLDFNKTNPEIIGDTFKLLKEQTYNNDPYKEIRDDYNQLFLRKENEFEQDINHSFIKAIQYAIIGNIIDFSPLHNDIQSKLECFNKIDSYSLEIDHSQQLLDDIKNAEILLYLGDNCGEIVLDKLLIKEIKRISPQLRIYFSTRGYPVANDNIEEDAYTVGIDKYADIINNGDSSLGTVLYKTSQAFRYIYEKADVIIAKGQANYESLSDEDKNIYYLLMVKCDVISQYIGVKQGSMVCYKGK